MKRSTIKEDAVVSHPRLGEANRQLTLESTPGYRQATLGLIDDYSVAGVQLITLKASVDDMSDPYGWSVLAACTDDTGLVPDIARFGPLRDTQGTVIGLGFWRQSDGFGFVLLLDGTTATLPLSL